MHLSAVRGHDALLCRRGRDGRLRQGGAGGMQSGALLVAAISALEGLCSDEPLALVRFLLAAFPLRGIRGGGGMPRLRQSPCGEDAVFLCGRRVFLRRVSARHAVPASESTFCAVRAAQGKGEATPDGIVRALRLLGTYFARQVERNFRRSRNICAFCIRVFKQLDICREYFYTCSNFRPAFYGREL